MNEKLFADLVKKGLDMPNVNEEHLVYIVCPAEEGGDKVDANIIGLALIGAVGVTEAVSMAEKAYNEIKNGKLFTSQRINDLLGFENFSEPEKLVLDHFSKTAREIIETFV